MIATLALALAASGLAPGGAQADSLLAAATRAAQAWRRHDFAQLVAGDGDIQVHLPGADPSAPLRPPQAAELLRAFAEGAHELDVEVRVARNVDQDRAYVEIRRTFTVRGTSAQRVHTVYLGLRRRGNAYRLVEVRVVP